MQKNKMLESSIESTAREKIEKLGGDFKKLYPLKKGDPDRLLLIPAIARFHQIATVIFIEMKRPGEKPTKLQCYRHQQLRDMGFRVEVCHSYEEVIEIYKREMGIW